MIGWFLGPFWFDCLACVPVLIYEAIHGFTTDYDEKFIMIHSSYYRLYVSFKLFKLLKLINVVSSLTYIYDLIKDVFVRHKVSVEIAIQYIKSVF